MLRESRAGKRRTPEELAAAQAEWEREEAAARVAHEAEQRRDWPEFLRDVGVPDQALAALARQEPLEATLALEAAERFLSSNRRFLVLSGCVGTGKTVAACWCLRASRRRSAERTELLEWWRGGAGFYRFASIKRVSDYEPRDQELFARACERAVLVLDEVGGRPGQVLGDRHLELLEELIDRRDVRGRRTIITTNLVLHPASREEKSPFAAFVGDRVASRLASSLQAQDCGTEDLRRRGRTP
jgi:DNA replication protein DnaC